MNIQMEVRKLLKCESNFVKVTRNNHLLTRWGSEVQVLYSAPFFLVQPRFRGPNCEGTFTLFFTTFTDWRQV